MKWPTATLRLLPSQVGEGKSVTPEQEVRIVSHLLDRLGQTSKNLIEGESPPVDEHTVMIALIRTPYHFPYGAGRVYVDVTITHGFIVKITTSQADTPSARAGAGQTDEISFARLSGLVEGFAVEVAHIIGAGPYRHRDSVGSDRVRDEWARGIAPTSRVQ